MASDLAEQIRTWTAQLHESRINGLRIKILLTSLKEITDSGEVTGILDMKINKVLLFGDINEYLNIPQRDNEFPFADRTLLGILKNPEYECSVKLLDEEKITVLDLLRKNITQKNQLVYQIFGRYLQNVSPKASEENLKQLVNCLKTAVTSNVLCDQHTEISANIKKCYAELGKCQVMLDRLVGIKLESGESLFSSTKRLNELEAQAIEAKSKGLLGDMMNELLDDDGAAALEIIHRKQKEEMEMKKLELLRLREEVSKYENMKSEGFDDLLKEYLDVTCRLKHKKMLREDYVKNYNRNQEG